MPAVHRLGDENDGGGVIESIAQGTVFVNEQLASIDGSIVSGHDLHLPTTTANGSTTVFIGGIPVNRLGDPDECGHSRAEGSPNVFIGNGDGVSANGAGASAGSGAAGGNDVTTELTPGEIIALGPNISSETAKAAAVAMSRAVVSAVIDVNATAKYPNLPYGADNSGSPTASIATANEVAPTGEFALTNQDGLALSMNYQDKILNSPAMKERFPTWAGLPYGGNNA